MAAARHRAWAFSVGLSLVALALAYLLWPGGPAAAVHWGRPVLVADVAGMPRMPSFAPNGNLIAFVNSVDGTDQVFVKHIGTGPARQLTFGDLPARRPRWSPADDQILFTRGTQTPSSGPAFGHESIWSVPPLGGAPHLVIEDGRNPNWSRDGSRIVFERRDEVWIAGRDGKTQVRIDGVPRPGMLLADRTPAFSPDGARLAFFQPESGPGGDLWVIPVRGGPARRLTFDACDGGNPVWTPDGRGVVYVSQRGGVADLWRVGVSGGVPELVFGGTGENGDPDISADGRRVAFSNTRHQYSLVVLDPPSGRTREILERRLSIAYPTFSPAGDRIAFFAIEGGMDQINTIDVDGTNLNQVTRDPAERNTFPHWSADGTALYYYRSLPDLSYRRIPAVGGRSTELVAGWAWETRNGARVNATGDAVLSTETRAGKPYRTLVRDLRTGMEHALARPLDDPRSSADGQVVLGTDLGTGGPPQGTVSICPVDGASCLGLVPGYLAAWSPDGRSVYHLKTDGQPDGAELRVVSTTGGADRKVAELGPLRPIAHFYDVSVRGEVVYVQFRAGKRDLWLADVR